MWPNPQFPVDLVKFTEEIFNEKLHFLCCESDHPVNSFQANVPFLYLTPANIKKPRGFLIFQRGMESEHCPWNGLRKMNVFTFFGIIWIADI